jgi:hypothetical protein
LAGISRAGLAAECFGTDPYVQSRRIHEQNLAKDFGYLKAVAQSESTMLAGLGAAARMVWKGRRSLGGEAFVLNVVIDAASPQGADANMAIVHGMARNSSPRSRAPSVACPSRIPTTSSGIAVSAGCRRMPWRRIRGRSR